MLAMRVRVVPALVWVLVLAPVPPGLVVLAAQPQPAVVRAHARRA